MQPSEEWRQRRKKTSFKQTTKDNNPRRSLFNPRNCEDTWSRWSLSNRRRPLESLKERSSTEVFRWTVQHRLYERQLKKVVETKKPFASPTNCRKRVEFARRYSHWTVEQWKKVIWSDESPFVIRYQNRQYVCFRSPNEKFSPRCLQGTVKHQKNIMVWGCFSWYGLGGLHRIEGILKKEKYRQILIHQMRPLAKTHVKTHVKCCKESSTEPMHQSSSLATAKSRFEPYWESMVRDWSATSETEMRQRRSCSSIWNRNGRISARSMSKILWRACQTGVQKL